MFAQVRSRPRSAIVLSLLVALLAATVLLYFNEQRVLDWVRLYGYTAPASVSALARDDAMTPYAEHLFYVNKPSVSTGSAFTSQCPTGSEKTVVLGCYKSGDRGIYLYQVTDSRLNGVVQVTAAHEMLHAAYARLPSAERARVDHMLTAFYQHGLQDDRIKKIITQYKQAEPDQLQNEMHSVFGTEVGSLSPELETYYARYFTNRARVVAYMNAYEAEFTSRQEQIEKYDARLQSLKKTIETNQASLTTQREALSTQLAAMDAQKAQQNVSGYNQQIASYNIAVRAYNTLLAETRTAIDTYNQVVEVRNAVVLEEQQLTRALSAQSLPSAP